MWIFLSSNMICSKCLNFESNKVSQIKKMTTKQSAANLIPAKSKAPISTLSNGRVKVTIQHYRTENKALKSKIDELQLELERSPMKVSAELSEDLISIISKTSMCNVTIHEVLLGRAAKIFEKFIKRNQIDTMRYQSYDEIRCNAIKGTVSDSFTLLKTTRNCLYNSGFGKYTHTCGRVEYLFYGTILLTYFMKIVNVSLHKK